LHVFVSEETFQFQDGEVSVVDCQIEEIEILSTIPSQKHPSNNYLKQTLLCLLCHRMQRNSWSMASGGNCRQQT